MKKKLLFSAAFMAILLWGATTGNIQWTQIRSTDRHGTDSKGQSSDGTGTIGNLAKFNSGGGLTDGPALPLPVANGGSGTSTPSLVAGTNVTISGSWPNQTVTASGGGGGGGGGWTSLESHTATVGSTSSLAFTAWYSATYRVYVIMLEEIVASGAGVTIILRCSTNGGSSYDSTSTYYTSQIGYSTGGAGGGGPAQTTSILLMPFNGRSLTTTSGEAQSAAIMMWSPGSTSLRKRFSSMSMYDYDSAAAFPQGLGVASNYQNTAAVNAIQISTPSGTFGGIVTLYGIGT